MENMVIFEKDGEKSVLVKVTSDLSDRQELHKAFMYACSEARADGWNGKNYLIPKKYLKKYGISFEKLDCLEWTQEEIEDQKILQCTCDQCASCDPEWKYCLKHSGPCRWYVDDMEDCIHGTHGNRLAYGDKLVSRIVFQTELTPLEAVKHIIISDSEVLEHLKNDLQAFLQENKEIVIQEGSGLWNYKFDN